MVCFHPLTAFYPILPDSDGKRKLIFNQSMKPMDVSIGYDYAEFLEENPQYAINDVYLVKNNKYNNVIKLDKGPSLAGFDIRIPCGKCIGCRLDYSREYAVRCSHEAQIYREKQHPLMSGMMFITLTFNDVALERRCDWSLKKKEISSWIKRFRRYVEYHYGVKDIKIVCCGEYGSKNQRPHYHLLVYGFRFPDCYKWSVRKGNIYYRSNELEKLWKDAYSDEANGFSIIGDVDFQSSAYVARYVTKKVYGEPADYHYLNREKEFLLTPHKEGLGFQWFQRYYKQIFDLGYITVENGNRCPIPRYYWDLLQKYDFDLYECKKLDKLKQMINNLYIDDINSTKERLLVREELKKMKCDKLVRIYEFDGNLHNI